MNHVAGLAEIIISVLEKGSRMSYLFKIQTSQVNLPQMGFKVNTAYDTLCL